jgi:putative glycosyltransferase (TIGR04372 family)
VGATVEHPLPDTGNQRIIDYATHFRSEFMDIFLLAHTHFLLGSLSGLYMGAAAFDRPVVITNKIDIFNRPNQSCNTFIPKLIRDKETGRIINFSEIIDLGLGMPSAEKLMWLLKSKYEYVENSGEEILEACKDMFKIISNKHYSEEADRLQNLFIEKFVSDNFREHVQEQGGFSPSVLIRYRELVE